MRIAGLARDRNNNFNLVRFLAATAVIFSHSYALTGHGTDEPLLRLSGGAIYFGPIGVTLFFIVSGFLVSKSFIERRSLGAFAAARVLRIYPALIAATLFSVAIAGAASGVPWREFLVDPQTYRFLTRNSAGWNVKYFLPGAFVDNPYPRAVNGSLWTIPLELRFYLGCGIAGALTLLRRRALFNVAFVAGLALFVWRPDWFPLAPNVPLARQPALAFAIGGFAWVNRDSIVLSPWAAAVALFLLAIDPDDLVNGPLFAPLVTYALLTFALHPHLRLAAFNRIGDYSYGLYVYAFPIQQALVSVYADVAPLTLFGATFALTLAVAVASWHGIEKPALRLKARFSRRPHDRFRR